MTNLNNVSQLCRCVIIGEGTLPIQCAEILLQSGYTICSFISSDETISHWAKERSIPHANPSDNLLLFLQQTPFDYLFSIVNFTILPPEVLNLPQRMAVNYHDGPLPRYAGTHATTWAILHQEQSYAITWHVMVEQVDAGDILRHIPVEMTPNETALSLNLKCYDAAIRSFPALINDLTQGTIVPRPQNVQERSFFSLYQRPVAQANLSWQWSAQKIDHFVRSLQFGDYPNPLGMPKFCCGNDFIIVSQVKICNSASEVPAGTIVNIDETGLRIATSTQDIELCTLHTITGQPLPISAFVAQVGLAPGYHFKELDYALTERITTTNARICQHEQFWVNHLAQLQPLLASSLTGNAEYGQNREMQADRSFHSIQDVLLSTIPSDTISWLQEHYPKQEDLLLTVFVCFLARMSDVWCFDIGIQTATLAKIVHGLAPLFAPLVPLRANLCDDWTFDQAYHAVQQQISLIRNALTYAQDCFMRYPRLRFLAERGDISLFPVGVVQLEQWDSTVCLPSAALTLVLTTSDPTTVRWVYDANLFDKSHMERLADHYITLLNSIQNNPTLSLAAHMLLSTAEQHRILVEWNATKQDVPEDICIHHLFDAQAQRTPNAIAIVFEEQTITYHELYEQSNRLAHYLQEFGVGPDVLVGICLERSIDMVIGLLGILKAGGAYVPLDPTYPQDRLAFMVEDAAISILLTQQSLNAHVPTPHTRVVCLDIERDTIAERRATQPPSTATAHHLAYVIYTSGSTGKPKGVQILHQAVVNFLHSMRQQPGLTAQDRLLAVTTLSFDIAVLELFLPLVVGAQIILASRDNATDGYHLARLLESSDATVMQATPATWKLLIQSGWQGKPTLKILCGGEALPRELANQLLERGASLWNLYGPTETTIWSTLCHVERGFATISLGRPIANTTIYILDKLLHPVPIGVIGTLYIGGRGLSRGYLQRPDLTAEKFIPHPFSKEEGERIYCTGDLARYRADGTIDFLGRSDHQVKIRGFRIELGEIEAILLQHPAVQEAVVIDRTDAAGNHRLVAYVVANHADGEPPVTIPLLRQYVQTQLPDYMVPSLFVFLERMPLTPNRKIDRRALPEPETTRPIVGNEYVAPRTPLEKTLVSIWSTLLGIEQIGIHDHFFELGGDSLLATQVIARLRDSLSVEIPLHTIFEAPTIAGLSKVIASGQHNLLTKPERETGTIPRLAPRSHYSPVPASFAQKRLWFLDQWNPGNPVYNIPIAWRLQGTLNIEILHRTLNTIVERHEMLRTSFVVVEGHPQQTIASTHRIDLPITDLRHIPEQEREANLNHMMYEEMRHPFDLSQVPLLRTHLFHIDERDYVFLLTMHHIITDYWSLGILFHEMTIIYEAYQQHLDSPLAPLPIQYRDFAAWQHQWIEHQQHQIEYWREQLQGFTLLKLPTDRPRPAMQTYHGATTSFRLSDALTAQLQNLSQQHGVTLFMTLLATFNVLLARYSGQDDIVIGMPIANRTRSETESLIGCFTNTLTIRTDLSGHPSFTHLLQRIRTVALEAYAHQDLPFERLVEVLQPQRDMSRHPIFQVTLVFQNTPYTELSLPDLNVQPCEVHNGTAKFDLSLELRETPLGLLGIWEYNTDLFDRATIDRLSERFHTLLSSVVTQPQQEIGLLPMLSDADKHRLVIERNRTTIAIPPHICLHHLFEAQVKRTPENIAVIFEHEEMSYQTLNQRANNLAGYLHHMGVGPGVLVGICVERSPDMIVGLLAILKAGGAYVPLDPAYPEERLRFMISDSAVPILLTQKHLEKLLPAHQAQIISLDSLEWSQSFEHYEHVQTTPDHLAYVIYTSGSTGQPKGVMISHRAIVNHMIWIQQQCSFNETDIILQKTPVTFDASVWEIYAPLMVGGRLVLAKPDGHRDSAYLAKLIADQHVTILQLVPSLLRVLLEEQEFITNDSLRIVFCGGEVLTRELQERFFAALPATLYNLYGPTEATIDATFWMCQRTPALVDHRVPIGHPIANMQAYILDTSMQPVPEGVIGELYLGGLGLAQGYLHRPELTAERFVASPFQTTHEGRLYRTGDLAFFRPDGAIMFVGRVDHQVKVRGFRIELGEIESLLVQHPLVQEAIVVVREDQPDDVRLVAYVIPTPQNDQTHGHTSSSNASTPTLRAKTLRKYAQTKLPDYMVPSTFMIIDKFPLTPNGKIDRHALPKPGRERPDMTITYVPPRTAVERALANIWQDVLDCDQVGIHDNFFELGGHSLQTIQLVSKLETLFHQKLSVRTLFLYPTIAELAAEIESHRYLLQTAEQEKSERNDMHEAIILHPHTPHLILERRSLVSLILTGSIEKVEAATLGYLEHEEVGGHLLRHTWSDELPLLRSILDTPLGRIGIILLPRFRAELYANPDDVVDIVIKALRLAGHVGAHVVSLAGLIPSATAYGKNIVSAIQKGERLPSITTGHATTTATVVMSIKRMVQESGRRLTNEHVGFLGLGSVGSTSLRLMLRCLPHPAEITLCDLYSKYDLLEQIKKEIVTDLHFRGTVHIVEAQQNVPPEFYQATLIVGATNVPNILNTHQIRPGTLMVDDSAPHCFNVTEMIERFHTQEDVLFSEGGVLQSPRPIEAQRYVPRDAERLLSKRELEPFCTYQPSYITGCVFSSILSARFDELKPTVGLVEVESALRYYRVLEQLSFQSAPLHCDQFVFTEDSLLRFRHTFGQTFEE